MPSLNARLVLPVLLLALLAAGCYPNPSPAGLTPIPTLAAQLATPAPVAAVTGAPTSAPRPTGAAVQGDPREGMALFTQNCAACHGANAEGGVGPALKGNQFVKTAGDDKVFEVIANGRPGTAMPAWSQARGGKLTDAQIDNLIAYLHELQR